MNFTYSRHNIAPAIKRRLMVWLAFILVLLLGQTCLLLSQQYPASPANWLYPDGSPEGTRNVLRRSLEQSVDSFCVKWSSSSISGDVLPLVGNVINNPKIQPEYPWAPNEIVAVIGGKLVVLDAAGKTHRKTQAVPYLKNISVLYDTTSTVFNQQISAPVVLGLEFTEFENLKDTLIYSFIAGFDQNADTIALLQRLAIDLRQFKDHNNFFGSIKPVFGRTDGTNTLIYSVLNMTQPNVLDPFWVLPPYLRGFTIFNTGTVLYNYPLPDVGDDLSWRVYYAPEVSRGQPSISQIDEVNTAILLPCYPTPSLSDVILDNIFGSLPTEAKIPYLIGLNISGDGLAEEFSPLDLTSVIDPNGSRPMIRPYYLHLSDPYTPDSIFILVAEEYKGNDGSAGTPRLHLFARDGSQLTFSGDLLTPPHVSNTKNHSWSIGVGDIDGGAANSWSTFYPNNAGNEIVLTQSTRGNAVAGNKLEILRYYSGPAVFKPSPPNSFLYRLDTICTFSIDGWLAAVNALDGASDGKAEIVLCDGSKLLVLRIRDYSDIRFRFGNTFDTVFYYDFHNQDITSVSIADIEGDGRNDLIVTTFDSLFVLGSVIPGITRLNFPVVQQNPPVEYCANDTVDFQWRNDMRGHAYVNLYFRAYESGQPTSKLKLIQPNIYNQEDTINFHYAVDSLVIGSEGRFILESTANPGLLLDSTSLIRFDVPQISIDALENTSFRAGDIINVSGYSACVDSVALEYSMGDSLWVRLATESIAADGSFSINAELPCIVLNDSISSSSDTTILIHLLSFRLVYADTTDKIPIKLLPSEFPVYIDTALSACPVKTFRWNYNDFKFPCDTMIVAVSYDSGDSYTILGVLPSAQQVFSWNVPLDAPDVTVFRFICMNSCIRTDSMMQNFKPKYINIIAPNPFRPPYETMEFVYKVPFETDVSISILDESNRIVAEPVKNQTRFPNTAYCDKWNGTLWDGSLASNGMYYLLFELSNGLREVYPVFVKK